MNQSHEGGTVSDQLDAVEAYLSENSDRFVEDLKGLLRIPSVSADSQFAPHMKAAAENVAAQMEQAGVTPEIIPTDGHAIVYGEVIVDESAPTAVVYGHYDVQPPDPLEDWISPPFEPEVRDDHIYARGATDDKGQMLTHFKSVEAWTKTAGRPPMNIKFVIEGEEEVGSENLDLFLAAHKERLKCDVAVVSDTSQYAPGLPAITYGLRGTTGLEVTVRGPSQDLHSGVFGGSVVNPANALARMVGSLIDDHGRVQVPGFYDDVRELSEDEREKLSQLPFDEQAYADSIGVPGLFGEDGYTTLERRWVRPTCDVNGLVSGYTGEGPKTIVPSWATAKISCRMVPDQDASKLQDALESFLRAACPDGLKVEFHRYHSCAAQVFNTDSGAMSAASRAIEHAFGTAPVMIREGGSIPVVSTFQEILGVDTLLLGWGQNTDNLHSPNERFRLTDYHLGIRASARLWYELAQGSKS